MTVINKYCVTVKGYEAIDIYDVLVKFGVTCPATAHAIKKLLMAGKRGSKDRLTDLRESAQAIARAIEIEERKT